MRQRARDNGSPKKLTLPAAAGNEQQTRLGLLHFGDVGQRAQRGKRFGPKLFAVGGVALKDS